MKASEIKCELCGQNMFEASERGAFLRRVSEKGKQPVLMECSPSCDQATGNQDDALFRAVHGDN
jgi:hypothetical protein